jgi:primosomal protein N''
MKRVSIFILVIFSLFFAEAKGQDNITADGDTIQISLNLQNVVYLAITQSASVRNIQNRNVNYFWRWRNFKTRFMPQLTFKGVLPNYRNSVDAVQQNDGTYEYKDIKNVTVRGRFSFGQYIPQTGTNVYAYTELEGQKNLQDDVFTYAGSPVTIGFSQPVFAYNWMKWYRKTEPLVYDEAQKRLTEEIEEISRAATRYFFSYLTYQTNYTLAENNLKNNRANLTIAETRRKLGQISENDFERIKLSVLNSQKALSQARMSLKNADFTLKSYVGLDQDHQIKLELPLDIRKFDIDPEKALAEAIENRKETTYYKRRLINADRDLASAKSSTGLIATLTGEYGLVQSADQVSDVYSEPNKKQVLSLGIAVPILDWGRSASTVKLAESERELSIYEVNKGREDFERSVIVLVEQYKLLDEQLKTATEADKVANSGYKIAQRKFQNGEISITELNIAVSEKDKAKRDYIGSLYTYWLTYYNIREKTLYDFENNEKLNYQNPMLINEKHYKPLFSEDNSTSWFKW